MTGRSVLACDDEKSTLNILLFKEYATAELTNDPLNMVEAAADFINDP
jgi:hypothetical protein